MRELQPYVIANKNAQAFLESSEFIDWREPAVFDKAIKLSNACDNKEQVAQACFNFVRDEIQHRWDYQRKIVTCRASDVLKHTTGFCYAKSHLLAALLRANNIPAALCYQRLTNDDVASAYCLHGLNAVYLEQYGWYRVDARGNKEGVNADFTPPTECLAFPLVDAGEADIEGFYLEPLTSVVEVLSNHQNCQQVLANLPDLSF